MTYILSPEQSQLYEEGSWPSQRLIEADLPLKKALGFPVLSNISVSYRD